MKAISKLNGRRVTIQQVAKEAGVSSSTVSRVLTGNTSVRKDLRVAVLQAVERLAYRPNQIARSLKIRETRTLGLLINDILNPFYGAVAKGMEDLARAAGYSVIFCSINQNYQLERDALSMLHDKGVDGIIVAPVGANNYEVLKNLLTMGVRLVQIDRQLPQLKASAVLLDNLAGAYQATHHLLENGYTPVGLVSHVPGRITLIQREQGYTQALQDAGLAISKSDICHVAFDMSDLADQVQRLLTGPTRPAALLVTNNRLAIGVLRTIKELGFKIPDDVALVMFDDLELFELHAPPITAVAQPAYAMGYKAAELLLEQLNSDSPVPTQVVTFHPELIVRDSSRPHEQQPLRNLAGSYYKE
ncbi:MAG: LacI family transcriptional regulator [Chloroflexi bacterium]|nr:LacI family transcriptional regulator [Chloroflexota bacterium]MCI0578971.1 LacI family transcriptional regulator [Chloroflexota bacterium]MCI0645091.1 LacI family transcriptional regulator [Chloroflexota bacterium]MCI0731926.1 LacI family transcriptional regulator [Chloroflexota bacterium]